jgi:hypothetical protein
MYFGEEDNVPAAGQMIASRANVQQELLLCILKNQDLTWNNVLDSKGNPWNDKSRAL